MKKLLFIIVLTLVAAISYGQREKDLPLRPTSTPSDTIRVLQYAAGGSSSLMLRSVLQGAIYDSLATHTDTLQALRADIDAGGSSLLLDSINQHRIEIDANLDSIAIHRTEIDANLDSIAVHRDALDNAVDSIVDHRTEINANTSTGANNGVNISSNSVFIGVNTADIGSLEDSIAKHTDTLQVHQGQIAALSAMQDSTWESITVNDTIFSSTELVLKNTTTTLGGNLLFESTGATVGGGYPAEKIYTDYLYISEAIATPNVVMALDADPISIIPGSSVLGGTGTGGHLYLQRGLAAAGTPGDIYFGDGSTGHLDNDDAETNLVGYDSSTGLASYRTVSSLASSGTVTEVIAGNGMNFPPITASGSVTMGTPSTLTLSTTNALTTTSHTHALSIANFTSSAAGLAPLSGGGTTNFLRADGAWAAPSGGSSYTFSNGLTETSGTVSLGGSFSSNISLTSTSGNSFEAIVGDGSPIYSYLQLTNTKTILGYDNSSGSQLLVMDGSEMLIWDTSNSKGLEYEDDYSANATARTLTDSAQVADMIAKPGTISHSLTDGAPTDAQIDSATGTTPSTAGVGWIAYIKDSDGSGLMYIIISDGTNWQYTALTIAL